MTGVSYDSLIFWNLKEKTQCSTRNASSLENTFHFDSNVNDLVLDYGRVVYCYYWTNQWRYNSLTHVNPLATEIHVYGIAFFKPILRIDNLSTSWEISFRRVSQDPIGGMLSLIQAVAKCGQTTWATVYKDRCRYMVPLSHHEFLNGE